jgi:hypothetical protein
LTEADFPIIKQPFQAFVADSVTTPLKSQDAETLVLSFPLSAGRIRLKKIRHEFDESKILSHRRSLSLRMRIFEALTGEKNSPVKSGKNGAPLTSTAI